ncbi:hypothetical protein [Microbacterium sp.]|uniref:DUF7507 domain-containing protein n=1 Tax=Microbacterium sp. TaxID=51671 RepID=UPI003A86D9B6
MDRTARHPFLATPPRPRGRHRSPLTAALVVAAMFTAFLAQPAAAANAGEINGTVFHDLNGGVMDGTGIGVTGPQQLYVNLIDSSGSVVANTAVAVDGTYQFTAVPDGTYRLAVSTVDEAVLGNIGDLPSIVANVPPNWEFVAEGVAVPDGTADGTVTVELVAADGIDGVDFAITEVDSDGDGIPDTSDSDWNGNSVPDDQEYCFNTYFDPDGQLGSSPADEPAAPGTADGVNWGNPTLRRTNLMHSGQTALTADNNNGLLRIAGANAVSPFSVGSGLSIAVNAGSASFDVAGIDEATLDAAIAAGDYVTFTVQTDNDFARAHIDWVGLLNRNQGANPSLDAWVTYQVSSNAGGSWTELATWHVNNTPALPYPAGRLNTRILPYGIAHDTLYTFRYAFYNAPSGTYNFDDPFIAFDACTYTIRGSVTIENDTTIADGVVNGAPYAAGAAEPALWANLLHPDGTVWMSVPVAADGTYLFGDVDAATDYTVLLTTSHLVNGTRPTAAALPPGWVSVGDDCCDATGTDGTADSAAAVPFVQTDLTHVDFSLARVVSVSGTVYQDTTADAEVDGTPISAPAGEQLFAVLVDVGGTVLQTVPVAADGTYTFPNVTPFQQVRIVMDTVAQVPGATAVDPTPPAGWVATGESPAGASGNDGTADGGLTLDVGDTSVAGNDFGVDEWPSVSGSVFRDGDGVADGAVDGAGVGSVFGDPVFVVLVDAAGTVAAVTQPSADGTFSFADVAPGDYSVQVSATVPTVGDPVGAASVPGGWAPVGEDCCDGSGSDGVADGTVAVTVAAREVTGVGLGIEEPPVASDVTAGLRMNPGGSTQVAVPDPVVADAEDGTPSTIVITTLPSPEEGVLFYDGVAVVAGEPITDFDPALLMVDPADAAATVAFDYVAVDAAGVRSAPATVSMEFGVASLDLVKSATASDTDGSGAIGAGDTVEYSFRVTNTGTVPLVDVVISDPALGWVDAACVAVLAVGASADCATTGQYVLTAADVSAGYIENTATGAGQPATADGDALLDPVTGDPYPPVTDVSDAGTTPDGVVIPTPDQTETANPGTTPNDPDDPTDDPTTVTAPSTPSGPAALTVAVFALSSGFAAVGDPLNWRIVVTNSGEVEATGVALGLPAGAVLRCAVSLPVAALAPGESFTCTASTTATRADVAAGRAVLPVTVTGEGGGLVLTARGEARVPEAAAPLPPTGGIVNTVVPITGILLILAGVLGMALDRRRRRVS